jgi:S-adenosylmethionine hydrolase
VKNRRGDAETRKHVDKKPAPRVSASTRRSTPLITLLTDFGTADYFVGAVKGVILSGNPKAHIVDISHDIPPQDVEAAAFTLLAVHSSFPAGTIHVAIVDPGVGSSRKPLLVKAGQQFFVGPDNGLFSYVCADDAKIFQLTNSKYFRPVVSATFHGRDIFAPVAAALSTGIKPEKLGQKIADCVRLPGLELKKPSRGRLEGRIIHIDRFGNCVTNITPGDLTDQDIRAGASLLVNHATVDSFKKFFKEELSDRIKAFGIWGSAGFLEIAAENQSAAELLNVRRGDPVIVQGGSLKTSAQ